MAGPTQRIEQRYVHGVGASGALLAGALIAFISVVGLVSLALWPRSVDTGGAFDPGIPIPRLAAENPPSDTGTGSLSSSTATTPLAAAPTTVAPAPTVPAVHTNRKPSHHGGPQNQKGGSGNGVTTDTNGGQVTVIQPTTTGDGRSGSGTGSGSGGSTSHGNKHGTNHGPSGGSGGNSSQPWDQPSSGSGNGNSKKDSSSSGDGGPGTGHAYGHDK
jgi:hypothetical protein